MGIKRNQEVENSTLKKNMDELYEYLKNIFNLNKSLSSTLMVITLTAFIFLISLGYPDILNVIIIIGSIQIKVVLISNGFLVLSFFFFLTSTLIYHYSQLRLNSLYLYWDEEFTLSKRYNKMKKLYDVFYRIANFTFWLGLIILINAVVFVFLIFSTEGIIMSIMIFSILGIGILGSFLLNQIKNALQKSKKSAKLV